MWLNNVVFIPFLRPLIHPHDSHLAAGQRTTCWWTAPSTVPSSSPPLHQSIEPPFQPNLAQPLHDHPCLIDANTGATLTLTHADIHHATRRIDIAELRKRQKTGILGEKKWQKVGHHHFAATTLCRRYSVVVRSAVVRTDGHQPLSFTKPDINNSKTRRLELGDSTLAWRNGMTSQLKRTGGVRPEGWSWVAMLDWVKGNKKQGRGRRKWGGEHCALDFMHMTRHAPYFCEVHNRTRLQSMVLSIW